MGAADAIPGVSGGTIALITGIYERLIGALSSPNIERAKEGVNHTRNLDVKGITSLLKEMDVPFLLVLGAGIFSSVIFVLNIINYLLENFAVSTYAFFFGLIAASAIILYKQVDLTERGSQFTAIAGFIAAFVISGFGANSLGHGPLTVFLSGAVAISAMILPGISGSLILVILGQYDYMSEAVSKATEGILQFLKIGDTALLTESGVPVITFLLGAFTGIFSIVKVVDFALEKYRKATMAFLVSLMVGALRAPFIQVKKAVELEGLAWTGIFPEFTMAAVIGGATIVLIERKTAEI